MRPVEPGISIRSATVMLASHFCHILVDGMINLPLITLVKSKLGVRYYKAIKGLGAGGFAAVQHFPVIEWVGVSDGSSAHPL